MTTNTIPSNTALTTIATLLATPLAISSFFGLLDQSLTEPNILNCSESEYFYTNISIAGILAISAATLMAFQQNIPVSSLILSALYKKQKPKEGNNQSNYKIKIFSVGTTTAYTIFSALNDFLLLGAIPKKAVNIIVNASVCIMANIPEAIYRDTMTRHKLQLRQDNDLKPLCKKIGLEYFKKPSTGQVIKMFMKSVSSSLSLIVFNIVLLVVNCATPNNTLQALLTVGLFSLVFQIFTALPESAPDQNERDFNPLLFNSKIKLGLFYTMSTIGFLSFTMITLDSSIGSLPINLGNASQADQNNSLTSTNNCMVFEKLLFEKMWLNWVLAFQNSLINKGIIIGMGIFSLMYALQVKDQVAHNIKYIHRNQNDLKLTNVFDIEAQSDTTESNQSIEGEQKAYSIHNNSQATFDNTICSPLDEPYTKYLYEPLLHLPGAC